MNGRRLDRALLTGLIVLVLGGITAWAIGRGVMVPSEPAPMDELVEKLDEAPAVEMEPEILIRREWDLPVTRNERVDFWIDFLAGRNKERTHLWLERAGRYAPVILPELRRRGMPEDLIYLAMIESGFSSRAVSHASAVGIWQFIAETGRRYGLEVSTYVDERRDPVKATTAALDYLEELYERFGSWYLAAAAYNTGENRIDRILRQRAGSERGDDALYWRISPHIPRETRDYVPLMLAAGHIGKDPEEYGFESLEFQQPLAYEEVEVPGGVALEAVAAAAGVEAQAVGELNPHLLRGMTPPNRDFSVRIPVGTRVAFEGNFEQIPESDRRALASHTVQRGETLSHIAVRYGTTVAAIRAANGGIDPRRVRIGQRIQVPATGGGTATAAAAATQSSSSWQYHRVRRGDTLWGIARRYDVSVAQLQTWNNVRGSRILPGQRLRIRA